MQRLANAYCGGASNKEDGINEAVEALTDPNTARLDVIKIIVLISDSPYDKGDPVSASKNAYQQGITVHTISYGPDVDQTLMATIAGAAGGTHWHTTSRAEISNSLRQVARSVPTTIINEP